MKTTLCILLLLLICNSTYAQKSIAELEKEVKTTKKKAGKKSLAYADALVNLAGAYQEEQNWAKATEKLSEAEGLIKYPDGDPDVVTLEKAAINFHYINWKGAFLQDKGNAANLLPGTWFFNSAYYDQPEKIQAFIKTFYSKEHFFSNEGYAYWAKAKEVYEESTKDYLEYINGLYTILADKAVAEFGKDSEEHIGVLFGQANYNERVGDKELAIVLHQKVDGLYGRGFQTKDIPAEIDSEEKTTASEKRTNVSPSRANEEQENPAPIFTIVEQMPRFFGCEGEKGDNLSKKRCSDRKLMGFIYQNITYPDRARENGVEGTVVVQFTVSEYGHLYDMKVIRKISEDLAAEVLRLMNKMNEMPFRWVTGRQRGEPVRVKMNLPVRFKLN